MQNAHCRFFLLPSGLYRRYLDFTDSVAKSESWTITTGREFHPAPKITKYKDSENY